MADLLEISVLPSVDTIHVGDDFLLYIKLRNPSDTCIVRDLSITYDLPSGFQVTEGGSAPAQPRLDIIQGMMRILNDFFHPPPAQVTLGQKKKLNLSGIEVQPSEPTIITMPIRVGGNIPRMVDADTYHLSFEVQYALVDKKSPSGSPPAFHNQQIRMDLTIYNHIAYIILGGILGGAAGSLLKKGFGLTFSLWDLIFGILMGIILVVIFKRKASVQSFISIEDFWGGFLIGVAAGYGGQELISSYLPTGVSGTSVLTPTVTPTITPEVTEAMVNATMNGTPAGLVAGL